MNLVVKASIVMLLILAAAAALPPGVVSVTLTDETADIRFNASPLGERFAGGSPAPTDGQTESGSGSTSEKNRREDESTETRTNTGGRDGTELDIGRVEAAFVERLNAEREDRGRSPVTASEFLREMGVSHSERMAGAGDVAHSGIGDGDVEDRFKRRGLYDSCRDSDDSFFIGENAAGTWMNREVLAPWPDEETYHVESPESLARVLFKTWMHSDPHRKAMLSRGLESVGLGVVITDDGQVYAALELCAGSVP